MAVSWFAIACADRLGASERLARDDTLYRGLDGLLEHQDELFTHVRTNLRAATRRAPALGPVWLADGKSDSATFVTSLQD
jgi:hypothetical protein